MKYTTKLYDLIYDKLANNTHYEQFEPEMAEEMELVYSMGTGEAEFITMTINGKQYELTIKEVNEE